MATLFIANGIDKDIDRVEFVKEMIKGNSNVRHNAMFDAMVTKLCYDKLTATDA
jgi:hypothetical protein